MCHYWILRRRSTCSDCWTVFAAGYPVAMTYVVAAERTVATAESCHEPLAAENSDECTQPGVVVVAVAAANTIDAAQGFDPKLSMISCVRHRRDSMNDGNIRFSDWNKDAEIHASERLTYRSISAYWKAMTSMARLRQVFHA